MHAIKPLDSAEEIRTGTEVTTFLSNYRKNYQRIKRFVAAMQD